LSKLWKLHIGLDNYFLFTSKTNMTAQLSRKKNTPVPGLSYNARKALTVHIGEKAGTEIADLLQRLAAEIDELRRTKVSITRIVPGEPR
jgi:hypothetical protein